MVKKKFFLNIIARDIEHVGQILSLYFVTTGGSNDICVLTLSHVVSEKVGFNLSREMFLMDMVGWVLWHINLCRLFNAKSIFLQIIWSISNNSV